MRHTIVTRTALLLGIGLLVVPHTRCETDSAVGDPWSMPAEIPTAADNPASAERVELGRMLFFDPRLSGSNSVSCANCHNPGLGWTDGLARARSSTGRPLQRNTPTILNVAFASKLLWDGRADSLEEQALMPIASPEETDQSLVEMIGELKGIAGYQAYFERAFGEQGLNRTNVARALAAFQRTIVATESPFDRWRGGDDSALSESAARGFDVFREKGRCTKCHDGFNFTDNGFHNIGVRQPYGPDLGRFVVLPLANMRGAFKTPTLRDIALTAPYMHNGIYATLEEVVEHYDRGGDVKVHLSEQIVPLNLTEGEKTDLVEFMRSLTGEPRPIVFPVLPR